MVGMKEAMACHEIREGLFQKGYDIPLCADMHFQPKVAIKTAEAVEKIRINPGNFADGRKEDEANKVYESDADFLRDREHASTGQSGRLCGARAGPRRPRLTAREGSRLRERPASLLPPRGL